MLSSDSLRESFFNRAGCFGCEGVPETAAWAEPGFFGRGMSASFVGFDSCESVRALLDAGYRQVDTMAVLSAKGEIGDGGPHKVSVATEPDPWVAAYLRSFYGNEELAGVVESIVASLLRKRGATLLEARVRGKVVGVSALFRTPGIVGAYCVGTVPEYRRRGVATALLAKGKQIADSEGRAFVLQTLASDGALGFYASRGFEKLYAKLVLEKPQINNAPPPSNVEFDVSIERGAKVGLHQFKGVFGGFERVKAVRRIFGKETDAVLGDLPVEISRRRGYMRIDDERGSIVVSSKYLKEGREVDIYLDVIHELVHIRQHREGKELWDRRYEYIERPTELEAYKVAVDEARRIGMDENQVAQYLKVEWISDEAFARFLKNLGVKGGP